MSTTRGPFRPVVARDLCRDRLEQALRFARELDEQLDTLESARAVGQIHAAIVAVGEVVR
jgi:hypothetical protein